jgi:cytochrome b561
LIATGPRLMETAYDPITRTLHWLNAILAVIAIALAYGISGTPRHSDAREWLLMLHGSVGIAILATVLVWGGWRLRHRAPPPLSPVLTRVEIVLAHATQVALFLLFVAMPISGYTILAAAGQKVSFFGLVAIPPLAPQSGGLAQAAVALHLTGEFLIYGLLALHVGAALTHAFIRRNGIFERMLPRRF